MLEAVTPSPNPPPRELLALQSAVAGRYSIEREIGRGGMGRVYLAKDVALDRPVAMKVLPPAQASLGDVRQRFLREARTAARLSHPNIVPIFAVEEVGEFVFFVMAYVEGETLRQPPRDAPQDKEGILAAGFVLSIAAHATPHFRPMPVLEGEHLIS